MKKILVWMIALLLVFSSLPLQKAQAAAYDPVTREEGSQTLDLRFWNDEKPDIGFYINAGNRFLLETVTAPQFGTLAGEWSVMDLLRGYYSGSDYMNYVPSNYYEDYLERVYSYVIAHQGNLDKNKSTEWSRATLALSALGKDIRQVGEKGDYLYVKFVTNQKGEKVIDTNNSLNHFVLPISGDNTVIFDQEYGVEFNYTSLRTNKDAKGYAIVPAGTYTVNEDSKQLIDDSGKVVTVDLTEEYRAQVVGTVAVNSFTDTSIIRVDKPYDFVEKLSTSQRFSSRQGINGPIWILIAMETGDYELYTEEELTERGVKVAANDIATKGKMIDFILSKEITSAAGRVGGWALSGKTADPDITMMAVQGLAPYYLDEAKFKNAYKTTIDTVTGNVFDLESESFKQKYVEFKKAVERAVLVMSEDQKPNGGYVAFGSLNAESITQVIVGLTALDIDPLSDAVYLPTIDQTVSFIKEGAEADGVFTNNMIDALITFWAMGSGSSSEVSGFKHVTTGYDGGGGSGTSVNGMATDQAIYGLIAYDRFLKKEKRLYNMTDMINGEYNAMKATTLQAIFKDGENTVATESFSPYKVLMIPNPPEKKGYIAYWTPNPDGTGASYYSGEKLSTPSHDITLYAQYIIPYELSYELNGAAFTTENRGTYTATDRQLVLPTSKDVALNKHLFTGWFDNAELSGERVTSINNSDQTKFTFYAGWKTYEQAVTDVVAQIAALPEKITLSHEEAVKNAATAFNELPATIQIDVTNEATLNTAKQTIADLQQQVADREVAKKVQALIEQLPANVQVTDAASINEAFAAYNNLTEKQQSYIAAEGSTLLHVKSQLQALLAAQTYQNIASAITKLPNVDKVTVAHKEQILASLARYNALSDADQQQVDKAKLFAVVAKYIDMKIESIPAKVTKNDGTVITEIDLLYMDMHADIKKQVKKMDVFKEKIAQYKDLPKIEKANEVIAKIDAIPAIVTTAAKATITTARIAYDVLAADEKAYVTNSAKLIQAEAALQQAEAQELLEVNIIATQIATLPATITLTEKEAVLTLYNQYSRLSTSVKAKVSNAGKLVSAYNKIITLEGQTNAVVLAIQTSINALPATVTSQYKAIIEDIRKKYNALTAQQQAQVTITKLIAAENQIAALQQNTDATEQPISNSQVGTTVDSNKNGFTAIVSQAAIAASKGSTIEVAAPSGVVITLPKKYLQQIDSALQVGAAKVEVDKKPAFTIKLFKEQGKNSIQVPISTPVSIKIPKSTFQQATASLTSTDASNGVILGHTDEGGYEAVPYTFKNGSFTVTVSKDMTLVYSTEIVSFKDIQSYGNRNEIEALASRYIIKGYGKETFRPNATITRAQFASLISRALGLMPEQETKFKDLKTSEHKDAIQALYETGIMKGTSSTTFSPNAPLSRQHAAVVMARVFEYLDVDTKTSIVHFTDKDKINDKYLNAIGTLNRLNIMSGRPDGSFGPTETLTRGQLAKILQRTLQKGNVLQ